MANPYLLKLSDQHVLFSLQYNDLMKKKRIVLNDKDKIAAVIKELDEKKNEALRNAWKKVNKVGGIQEFSDGLFSPGVFGITKFITVKEGVQCMLVKFFARKAAWVRTSLAIVKGDCPTPRTPRSC